MAGGSVEGSPGAGKVFKRDSTNKKKKVYTEPHMHQGE
jgi:hypothetical protein